MHIVVQYYILLTAITVNVALAFCPTFFNEDKTCTCFAYLDGAMIKCKGPKSTLVVEKLKSFLIPIEIRELTLENANIIEIGPGAFRNLRIKTLNLDNNHIRAIHADAFRGLENSLVSLSIAHNKLTEIPTDALIGMNQLLILNLQCNNIGNIYQSAFRNVSHLIELNLSCNQICKISGPAFDSVKDTLQSLILDQNCLKEIPAEGLRNFKQLLALHLQYNEITSIDKLQFMNMLSLLLIRLTGNKINRIDRYGFNNVPNLRYLFLNKNQLKSIEPNTLQPFKFLEIIDLSHNNIAEISSNTFQGLEHIMQLNLESNAVRDIAPNAFAHTPLLLLLLGHNCLTSINQQMFQGIPFLKQLSLTNNNIKAIQPFAFHGLPTLTVLDLSRNKLKDLEPTTVTPSSQATVMLQENPMVCGQNGYHLVQNNQPILLINESNSICRKKDVMHDDACPNRNQDTSIPPCCHAAWHSKGVTTTLDSLSESSTISVSNLITNEAIATSDKLLSAGHKVKVDIASTTTSDEDIEENDEADDLETEAETTIPIKRKDVSTTTTTTTITTEKISQANIDKNKINMERFWRFTAPPPVKKPTSSQPPNFLTDVLQNEVKTTADDKANSILGPINNDNFQQQAGDHQALPPWLRFNKNQGWNAMANDQGKTLTLNARQPQLQSPTINEFPRSDNFRSPLSFSAPGSPKIEPPAHKAQSPQLTFQRNPELLQLPSSSSSSSSLSQQGTRNTIQARLHNHQQQFVLRQQSSNRQDQTLASASQQPFLQNQVIQSNVGMPPPTFPGQMQHSNVLQNQAGTNPGAVISRQPITSQNTVPISSSIQTQGQTSQNQATFERPSLLSTQSKKQSQQVDQTLQNHQNIQKTFQQSSNSQQMIQSQPNQPTSPQRITNNPSQAQIAFSQQFVQPAIQIPEVKPWQPNSPVNQQTTQANNIQIQKPFGRQQNVTLQSQTQSNWLPQDQGSAQKFIVPTQQQQQPILNQQTQRFKPQLSGPIQPSVHPQTQQEIQRQSPRNGKPAERNVNVETMHTAKAFNEQSNQKAAETVQLTIGPQASNMKQMLAAIDQPPQLILPSKTSLQKAIEIMEAHLQKQPNGSRKETDQTNMSKFSEQTAKDTKRQTAQRGQTNQLTQAIQPQSNKQGAQQSITQQQVAPSPEQQRVWFQKPSQSTRPVISEQSDSLIHNQTTQKINKQFNVGRRGEPQFFAPMKPPATISNDLPANSLIFGNKGSFINQQASITNQGLAINKKTLSQNQSNQLQLQPNTQQKFVAPGNTFEASTIQSQQATQGLAQQQTGKMVQPRFQRFNKQPLATFQSKSLQSGQQQENGQQTPRIDLNRTTIAIGPQRS